MNIQKIPFSRARSYMALSDLEENYRNGGNQAGIHLRTVRGGAVSSIIAQIIPWSEGRALPYIYEATPEELILHTQKTEIHVCFADDKTLLIKTEGEPIHVMLKCVPKHPFFHYIYEIPCRDEIRYELNCFGQEVKYLIWAQEGKAEMTQVWEGCTAKDNQVLLTPEKGRLLAVIREVFSSWDGVEVKYQYEESLKRTAADFDEFARKMPSVPQRYEETARIASYVDWSAIVAGEQILPRDTMFMSKNWMTNIWAWDHVFNAVALAYHNPQAAWDQWMIPFDLQDVTGLIPDTTNNSKLDWNYCKPPVHGWALHRMMKVMELSEEQLAKAYDKLGKWTEWWLNYRDRDHDGICEYYHGYDSGWDNATAFAEQPPVELPDLQTFLILQMETMAELAEKLGRTSAQQMWLKRADTMKEAMLKYCFADDQPIAIHAGSHERIPTRCLILYMPVLLGERLPEEIRKSLVEGLKNGGYLTDHGFATEPPESPFYEADGYWRGPIWAPSTLLLLDGLEACGEHEFAKDVAERFCNMVKNNGYAENFNALTGEGLRDLAYTWTPSVFLTIAHDYFK
ncbi:MAG: trehalase family glycosidase [Lachnospiraceae bacterium]|nr:trehalase family glycosidase [Lachnospiraceae bacterium]